MVALKTHEGKAQDGKKEARRRGGEGRPQSAVHAPVVLRPCARAVTAAHARDDTGARRQGRVRTAVATTGPRR